MAVSEGGNQPPRIVRKRIRKSEEGHHGGAWKVAYADFVTAMMAFFLLMWLLNATTEKQRKGLADYFNPVIPINRSSGGGEGAFGGESMFSEQTLAHSSQGTRAQPSSGEDPDEDALVADNTDTPARAAARTLEALIAERLAAAAGSVPGDLLAHLAKRMTETGLVIELFDLEDAPLFEPETAQPRPPLDALAAILAEVLGPVGAAVTLTGHVAARAEVRRDRDGAWALSAQRAEALRRLLTGSGLPPDRIVAIAGQGEREAGSTRPMSVRNNRIEIEILAPTP